MIDSAGLVLTNAHVVGDRYRIRVKFDDTTRVDARLLASDPKRDVAVVLVNPEALVGRPVLPLAAASDTMVFEGERVIAMGSPLNQEKIMTAGIVSKIEPTAVISDVNINPGNSGGPLVNMDGVVIAINTFGDFSERGPGVSGSVLITEALPTIASARAAMDTVETPSVRRLPVAPRGIFPIDSLQVAAGAKKFDAKPYYVHDRTSTGKFEVVVSTPVFAAWRLYSFEVELAKQTKKREAKGRVSEDQTYDPLADMREWMRYTRGGFPPVVSFEFTPKIGETGGSIFGNILGAA
ncbi:MAG: trypsin-like peptidase domain-containing protein, partial [Deltaproteobacteria bacterium]|nr:trypsin-like peptidase domain-containing protein [Deltaproteobacteria bacterium]